VGGALLLAAGIAMGALGAHALQDLLTLARLASWDTACLYMLVMGAALVGAPAAGRGQRRALTAVVVGTGLFSGSIVGLVALATLDMGAPFRAVLGPATPLGGVLMIGGWASWGWQVWASRKR
jgi:uncharacterized membrane protein YgdD (TMEM256/DUF423 family)